MSDLVQRLRDPESLLAELMARLGTDDPLFDAFREAMPDKYWARYDLSAARLGYEFARFAMLAAAPQQPAAQPEAYMVTKRVDVGIGVTRDVVLSWEPGLPDEPSEPLYTHPIDAAEVLRLADEYARKVALADHGDPADEVKVKQARAALAREVGAKDE